MEKPKRSGTDARGPGPGPKARGPRPGAYPKGVNLWSKHDQCQWLELLVLPLDAALSRNGSNNTIVRATLA